MDFEELLNLVSEQELVGEISDEEIFWSVVDIHEAEQIMEVNGGYNIDDEVVNKKPTCKEALTAAFTLKSDVSDINKPLTCKLEGILAGFGQQTWLEEAQSLETTYITDYFTCK